MARFKWPFRSVPGGYKPQTTIRSANRDLYSGSAYAGYRGVVPRLDERHKKRKPIEESLRENPLAVGPAWQLAFRLGALPIKVYRIVPESGERAEASDHPGYTLIRKPNRVLTRTQMIGGTVLQMLTFESAAWLKARPEAGGPPTELWPLAPGTFRPKPSKRGLIEDFELQVDGEQWKTIPFEDVCYFRLLPDPINWAGGFSPFRSLGAVAGLGSSAIDAATDFFDQGHMGTKWIDAKGAELSEDARDRFQANLEAQRKKTWLWPLMEGGFTLEDMGDAPSDEVLVSTMDNVHKVIMQTLGLPLDGDLKRLYAEAVQPVADAIEQELERSLFTEWPKDPAFPEFGFREILKGDPLERAQLHQTKTLSGGETPNEGRRAEGLPPLPGGDQLFVPLNLVPIGQAGTAETTEKDSAGGLGGDEGKGILPAAAKLAPVRSLRSDDKFREQVLNRHGEALATKIERVLGFERSELEKRLDDAPSMEQVSGILRTNDKGIERFLRGMMMETAKYVWSQEREDDLPDQAERLIQERASEVVASFGAFRYKAVSRAIEDRLVSETQGIPAVYEMFASKVPTLASRETAFAFDLAGTLEVQGVQSGT